MTIVWPDTLPCPRFGITFAVADPQLRSPFDSGYALYRRKLTAVPVDFPVLWVMSDAQAIEFEAFYRDVVKDGTLWFSMPLVTAQGDGAQFVRFMGAYSFVRVGNDLWEYSANMQMYLRPGSYALPPINEDAP